MSDKRLKILVAVAVALLGLVLGACGGAREPSGGDDLGDTAPASAFSRAATPTANPLPDLVVSQGQMALDGYAGGCTDTEAEMLTEVCVANQGGGEAGPFVVRALHRQGGGAYTWEVDGLGAGEEVCLEQVGRRTGRATVDVDEQVAESDERNNNLIVPLATPAPVCTPTLAPTESPTPLPPGVPTATPFPEGSKVRTEVFPVYNCTYLGNDIYEWYRVEVTYVDGQPVSEEVIRGPYQGDWQGGCPPDPAEPED